jgi:hypothetical protein
MNLPPIIPILYVKQIHQTDDEYLLTLVHRIRYDDIRDLSLTEKYNVMTVLVDVCIKYPDKLHISHIENGVNILYFHDEKIFRINRFRMKCICEDDMYNIRLLKLLCILIISEKKWFHNSEDMYKHKLSDEMIRCDAIDTEMDVYYFTLFDKHTPRFDHKHYFTHTIEPELMAYVWHPDRHHKWIHYNPYEDV